MGSCPRESGPAGNYSWALFLSSEKFPQLGSCPRESGPAGNYSWALFLSSEKFPQWGVVLGKVVLRAIIVGRSYFYPVRILPSGGCPRESGPVGNYSWALFLSSEKLSPVGGCPRESGPAGNYSWALFLSSDKFPQWGVVLGKVVLWAIIVGLYFYPVKNCPQHLGSCPRESGPVGNYCWAEVCIFGSSCRIVPSNGELS